MRQLLVYESVEGPFFSEPKEDTKDIDVDAAIAALDAARADAKDGYVIAMRFNGWWITDREI